MKLFASFIAFATVTSALAVTPRPFKPNEVYSCEGPFVRNGSARPLGAPRLEIQEFLVKAGPMLPAFNHVYVLKVRPQNPSVPSTNLNLEYVDSTSPTVHVYAALTVEGEKSTYTVEHDISRDRFTVKVGKGTFQYHCMPIR